MMGRWSWGGSKFVIVSFAVWDLGKEKRKAHHDGVERTEGVGGGELAEESHVACELARACRERVQVLLVARVVHQLVKFHLRRREETMVVA